MSGSIEFECPYCQKRSKVPAHYAGKRGACPGCKQTIEVPDPNAAGEVGDDPAGDSGYGTDAPGGDTKQCPMCGETIKKVAKKCKHCKSVLDKRLERSRVSKYQQMQNSKSEEMPGPVDWVLVLLCPGIACIVGLVALIQGYSKRGGIMVGVSVIWAVILNVLRAMLEVSARGY